MNLSDLIERLTTLDREATPGPWRRLHDGDDSPLIQTNHITRDVWQIPRCPMDMRLIAELRNALPLLIKSLEVTQAAMESEREGACMSQYYGDAAKKCDKLASEFRAMLEAT